MPDALDAENKNSRNHNEPKGVDRRNFLVGTAVTAAAMSMPRWARAAESNASVGLGFAPFFRN
jgi:hypothetical protein